MRFRLLSDRKSFAAAAQNLNYNNTEFAESGVFLDKKTVLDVPPRRRGEIFELSMPFLGHHLPSCSAQKFAISMQRQNHTPW